MLRHEWASPHSPRRRLPALWPLPHIPVGPLVWDSPLALCTRLLWSVGLVLQSCPTAARRVPSSDDRWHKVPTERGPAGFEPSRRLWVVAEAAAAPVAPSRRGRHETAFWPGVQSWCASPSAHRVARGPVEAELRSIGHQAVSVPAGLPLRGRLPSTESAALCPALPSQESPRHVTLRDGGGANRNLRELGAPGARLWSRVPRGIVSRAEARRDRRVHSCRTSSTAASTVQACTQP